MNVPGVRMVDAADGVLGIEWIEGQSVRHLLPGGAGEEDILEQDLENVESGDLADPLKDYGLSVGPYHHSTCSSFFFHPKISSRCLDGSHWHRDCKNASG